MRLVHTALDNSCKARSFDDSECSESTVNSDESSVHLYAFNKLDIFARGTFYIDGKLDFDSESDIRRDLDALQLLKEFPSATFHECIRFRTERSMESARDKLRSYFKWRSSNDMDRSTYMNVTWNNEEDIWNMALRHASDMCPNSVPYQNVPQFIRSGLFCPINQKRIVQIMAGMIDPSVASLEFYSLVFAMYFDLFFERDSMESVVVFVDVRSGRGWKNCNAPSLIPFIKSLAQHLDHFPERLSQCIVYPVPKPAKPFWIAVKSFLKERVLRKIQIHWGYPFTKSPPPKSLYNDFEEETIAQLESTRIQSFYSKS